MLYIMWRKSNELVKSVEGADDNALECLQVKAQEHIKKSDSVSILLEDGWKGFAKCFPPNVQS